MAVLKAAVRFESIRQEYGKSVFDQIFMIKISPRPQTSKKKGRELNAPPQEAPRSACEENAPSRARVARARAGLFTLKIRGFLARPAAEATQNCLFICGYFIVGIFLNRFRLIDFTMGNKLV